MKSFVELGVSPPILKALEEMGFDAPTEVQETAIPHILNQEDLIVMSKTGSGKTAVFGVSILQLTVPQVTGPQGLILTPTRELAVQIDSDLKKMAAHIEHRTTAVYGQHSMNIETQALKKGVCIVTGTPGRVFDHIRQGNLNTRNIRFLVLDEADRMLDMGFIGQVMKIIKTLPRNRVTLLFSATIPPEIHRICRDYMKNPTTIEIESPTKTVDTIEQVYYRVQPNEKRTQLNRLLLVEQPESCIIFCNTRIAVDQVHHFLTRKGYASHALHGDIPQSTRMKTMQQFKQGDFHILVATDVAARGIHIDDLSLVINYDIPNEKDNYIHRIGRTGRAGKIGRAVSLVTGDDIMSLYEIEEHIGALIEEAPLLSDSSVNEGIAKADAWLQANAIKKGSTSPNTTGTSVSGQQQDKPSQHRRQQRNRPLNHRSSQNPRYQNHDSTSRQASASDQSQPGQRAKHSNENDAPGTMHSYQDKYEQRTNSTNTNRSERPNKYSQQGGRTKQQANPERSENAYRQNVNQQGSTRQTGSAWQAANQQKGSARQAGSAWQAANQQKGSTRQAGSAWQAASQQKGSVRQAGSAWQAANQQRDLTRHSDFGKQQARQKQSGSFHTDSKNIRPQSLNMRKDSQNQSNTKKGSFLKRIFYKVFGK